MIHARRVVAMALIAMMAATAATAQPKPAPRQSAPAQPPSAAAPASGATDVIFPGGAASVNEVHDDWTVTCGIVRPANLKSCVLSQAQLNATSRQRVLTMQVQVGGDGPAGAVTLPFGVLLDRGAALRVVDPAGGDVAPSLAVRFRTCLPEGCVAPFVFDAALAAAIRGAKALAVTVRIAETGQDVTFEVSPKGFARAYDRAVALAR